MSTSSRKIGETSETNGFDSESASRHNDAELPVLPLPDGVVLPGMVVTVALESAEAQAVADAAISLHERLLLVPKIDNAYARVGVVASIESAGELPNGVRALVLKAIRRVKLGAAVTGPIGSGPGVLWLHVEEVDEGPLTDSVRALGAEYRATVETLLEHQQGGRFTIQLNDQADGGVEDPRALADSITYLPDLSTEQRVQALETIDVEERFLLVLPWVRAKLAELQLKEKIRHDVSEGMEKAQREFLLRQQLAAIKKELGDDSADEADSYRERLDTMNLPEPVRVAAVKEIDRMERMSEQNPEQAWIRNWLDVVFAMPWNASTSDRYDVALARSILDTDTTGLNDAKERITEWLAVRKLRAERTVEAPVIEAEGEILGTGPGTLGLLVGALKNRGEGTTIVLVGPPGVGKTSLGESVARAMDRRFVRVALGGVRDEAEIRGHRRTYVGAKPGRIVEAIREANTMNPVILLDEIDKLGSGWSGDPGAALLEVLDPAQNHTFRDHYLEVDLDLSNVIFIATANTLETIPGPLLDRMELITVDGYVDVEKVAIARNHLVPKQLALHGLRADDVEITDETVGRIVAGYTREAGVRSLERQIAKVFRKVAVKVSDDSNHPNEKPVRIETVEQLTELLGRPKRREELAARTEVPGVANGLAVTGAGGEVLSVEATSMPTIGSTSIEVTVTGQLGDVMKESSSLAMSYVRANAEALGIDTKSLDGKRIHVHFPAGATPKDGPSAGITMTTALVSLLTDRPVISTVAMTGELSLKGRVLPIGGVKQKLLAAHRAGLTTVILPKQNEPDLDDVPANVLEGLTVHLVDDVREVLRVALTPAVLVPEKFRPARSVLAQPV
jgi:ATP-dependent Lon protease